MNNSLVTREHNYVPLFLASTLFMLFFFAFTDFGIRLIFGFAGMMAILLIGLLTDQSVNQIVISKLSVAYTVLALFISMYILLPNARLAYDVFAMMISLDVSALYVIFAKPGKKEIEKAFRSIIILAIMLSFYTIAVALRPSIFHNFVSKIISSESARVSSVLLSKGYGVAIGGNVVLIDYIVFMAILVIVNTYIISGKGKKDFCIMAFSLIFFLLVMVLQNRKSELLMALIVVGFSFISKLNFTTIAKKIRNHLTIALGLIVFIMAFIVLAQRGLIDRYLVFLQNFSIKEIFNSSNSSDLTSGRIALWEKAWELFVKHPFFGIGWARFADHITVHNSVIDSQLENVHNNYLQLLCEVGIFGFIFVATPFFYIFIRTLKNGRRLRRSGSKADFPRIINSVSWGFQLFNILISFIDPSWYKMSFWWFFAVAVILAKTAERIEREEI